MQNKNLTRYRRLVTKINRLEGVMEKLKEKDFAAKTALFRLRLKKGEKSERILPEALALAREAARRKLNQRAFNVQLQGAVAACEGKIVEMKTGEGKSLTIVLAAYFDALFGRGVHVVTANDYLAQRDAERMKPVFELLGISVDFVIGRSEQFQRQVAYAADVTYVTGHEVGFDFLRDNMVADKNNQVQKGFCFALVDEADSVLIDEAQIPLVISESVAIDEAEKKTMSRKENNRQEKSIDDRKMFEKINSLMSQLKKGVDFKVDEKEQTVSLTIAGIKKLETLLGVHNLYQDTGIDYFYYVSRLLKAHQLFEKDRDYVVEEGKVVVVDEFTGRLMPAHRYFRGIHQAVEAKEGVAIGSDNKTLGVITYQHLFRKYEHLAGLTGTAQAAEKEFRLIYGKETVEIPPNKKIIRRDETDLFFLTWQDKINYLVWTIKEQYFKQGAVLVGTRSVGKSQAIGERLFQENVVNRVLNAKHTLREAEIVAEAGQAQTVTVATNMAGRGTDIQLAEEVRAGEGLVVLGTERHNTARIDNQLIGRAGRQGDPGQSRFLISADDELINNFYREEYLKELKKKKNIEEGVISLQLSNLVKKAQRRMEGIFFEQRILSFEFDKVLEAQRESFYRQRRRVLNDSDLKEETLDLIKREIQHSVWEKYLDDKGMIKGEDLAQAGRAVSQFVNNKWFVSPFQMGSSRDFHLIQVKEKVDQSLENYYRDFEGYVSSVKLRSIERMVTLKVLDLLWAGHLSMVEELQEAALVSSISQADFFQDYQVKMGAAYRGLLHSAPRAICLTMLRTFNRLWESNLGQVKEY